MTAKRTGKKFLIITGYLFGSLAILLIAFHIWFIHYARVFMEDFVEKKTNGRLKLKIEKLSYDYFNNRMKIKKAVFITTDSATGVTAYQFDIKEIRLQLKAIWPLIFQKKLLIDSLHLQSPDIRVTNLRYPAGDTITKNKKEISIPYEMGKVYRSIRDALRVLQVSRFQIDDGKFTLLNKIQPDQLPLVISNINFHIDNLQVDSSRLTGKEKLFFSDNVVLKCDNQDIIFPDGRHRLIFDRFRINLRKKLVEFDSCTISAAKTDSTKTSFSVFFDKLLLTNIDFDTLYKTEVIKADTVICLSPKFKLQTEVTNKKTRLIARLNHSGRDSTAAPGRTGKSPKLENIIQQLTGDLLLNCVIVSNASFDISTVKNGHPNSFTSDGNNFEMNGLAINQDAPKLIHVKSFAMAIRNYENFIKDSSYSVRFDSILFKDNHIALSHFILNQLDNGRIVNTFDIPHFYLEGLDWDDLVFEKQIKAAKATMINPFIRYTVPDRQHDKKKRHSIFEILDSLNNKMDLTHLDILNGTIDLKLKDRLQMKLENASLSIQSHSLLNSTGMAELRRSLTSLDFDKGMIRIGNLGMELHGIRYNNQNGRLAAANIDVSDQDKNINLSLRNVSVEKMLVDDQDRHVFADGIKWEKAVVQLNSNGSGKNNLTPSIEIRNVTGLNTFFHGTFDNKTIITALNSISFNELEKKADSSWVLKGLVADGKQLKLTDKNLHLSIAGFHIADNENSSLRQFAFQSDFGNTHTDIFIPSLVVTPHISPLLVGDIALDAINMTKPVIHIQLAKKDQSLAENKTGFPKMEISEMRLIQPEINITQASDTGAFKLSWHGDKEPTNFLQFNGLYSSGNETHITLKKLGFYLTDFAFTNPKGETFTTGDGKIAAQIKDISLEHKNGQPFNWHAVVSDMNAADFRAGSIGKAGGSFVINNVELNEFTISSSTINNLQKLAAANGAFRIMNVNGHYSDADKSFWWYNGDFHRRNNTFSLDSFIFRQELDKDSFYAKQKNQADYINAKTGKISIGPIDIDAWLKDTVLKVGMMNIQNALFTDFKDKNLPSITGIIKPLPVNLVRKIPIKLSVDSIVFNNAHVEYTETGEKTKESGTVPITRLTIIFNNVKNYGFSNTDSLRMLAIGYLMDTVWTRLRVKESYLDTMGGFLVTARMKPADIRAFNPVLIPLASIKLESADLDTMSMRATGKEFIAFGEMKMLYHNLKVRFLKDGDETKRSFLKSLLTFIANSFVIRNKNTSRTGLVFFIRMRDKSALNYLIKIAMSGIASSIGAKSSRRMMRKYQKDLKHRKLPPFDFD